MKKVLDFLLILTMLIVISLSLSSASYLSGNIQIYENGLVRFNADSSSPLNYEGLSFQNNKITGTTSSLTSKQADVWTFSLAIPQNTNTLLEISLPSSLSSIISIEGAEYILDIDKKQITILESTSPQLKISYKIKQTTSYSWILWLLVLILAIIVFFLLKRTRKRKEHLNHIMPIISDNEQKIIEALMKKPYRQKELRSILNIPKASFTRYLINLEKKKLIIREGEGKNKIIRLK